MRSSLMDDIGTKLDNARFTLCNLFQTLSTNDKESKEKEKEINFNDIIIDHSQQDKVNQQQHSLSSKQLKLQQKISQAVRNSTIAKTLYHKESPSKIQQKLFEDVDVLKQMENQMSLTNVSQILQLKTETKTQHSTDILSGILYKISPSFFGGWSERYCVLTKDKFMYLEEKDKNSPIAGIINFSILSFSVIPKYIGSVIDSFTIKVDNGEKTFDFKGSSPQQTLKWFMKIDEQIKSSQGKTKNATALSNYHRFWRKQYITQKEFEKIAQTGDILLFRGKKTSAILQRTMTQEQYDHIGVVLLNAFNEILIFEANGGFGVGICPWKKFIKNKWFQDQEIVAIRHLKIHRTEELLNDVKQFVENNIGKQYKFSVRNYLMSRNSTAENQKNSYFCSSLVAKLYKKLGLLDPNVSSNRYMPYDFSDKQKLVIWKGKYGQAQLEKERIIVFEKSKNKIFEKET